MECLVLGCPGSGKSTLLNRLSSEKASLPLPVLHPTIGSDVQDIYFSKRKCVRLREVSGTMRHSWSQYFEECRAVIFIIDLENRMQISTSQTELLKLLSNKLIQPLPVLLLFNKTKSPLAQSLHFLYSVLRLDSILSHAHSQITVLEADLSEDFGLEQISTWIKDKCK